MDNRLDADEEMERLMAKGFVKKISIEDAEKYFGKPVVSRSGLIMKEKADGTKKRRVIVDALRSGANAQAVCPERIVLPRPEDVHHMLKDMKRAEPDLRAWYFANKLDRSEWGAEFIAADLVDAFTHLPMAEEELAQCVSPAGDGKHVYVFVALFFGHKTAPLLMCRLSALFTRLVQGMFAKGELQLATYVDDPLAVLVGSRTRRLRNLSLMLLTLAALGIQLSWAKGDRGTKLVWIGVQFELRWREGALFCEVPDKLRTEILGYLDKWKGMIPVSELRSVTGKLTWAAGIYKRSRWAVSMLYAALAAHEAELKSGEEEARRARRDDPRNKDHLIPVKRFEIARRWLAELFRTQRLATKKTLWRVTEHAMIITDASPQAAAASSSGPPTPAPGRSSELTSTRWAGRTPSSWALLGSHKSQAYLEALALFLAVKEWGTLFSGIDMGVAVRSDSTVALAVADKESSSSPALNALAAELSLLLESHKVGQLGLLHIPGKMNKLADYLSRPRSRGDPPAELQEIRSTKPRKLKAEDFTLGLLGSHDATAAGATWQALTC